MRFWVQNKKLLVVSQNRLWYWVVMLLGTLYSRSKFGSLGSLGRKLSMVHWAVGGKSWIVRISETNWPGGGIKKGLTVLTNIVFVRSFFLVVALTQIAQILWPRSLYISHPRTEINLLYSLLLSLFFAFILLRRPADIPRRMGCCWIAPFDHYILCRLLAFE